MAEQPSGHVAFLFTDIEGSTRRWLADSGMQAAVGDHDDMMRSVVAEHDGYVFSTAGDSFGVAFASVDRALAAAVDIQLRLAAHEWPTADGLAVRIGVHVGGAELRDGDYFGPELSRAARIMDAAHGGQVLVSGAAAAGVDHPGLRPLGEHRLRDLPDPEPLYQLVIDGLPADFPPPRSMGQAGITLPAQLSSFVGRHEELARLRSMLAQHRLVTVTGTGGTGKTRLAIEAAGRERDAFPGGVHFVDLAAVTADEQITSALVTGVGTKVDPAGPLLPQVLAHLGQRQVLLLIDNCEHLLDGAADLVTDVLRSCPRTTVLTTSREPLDVDGERVLRIPSLASQGDDDLPPAVRLFIDRATSVNPDLPTEGEARQHIAEVCERLDGIPLAIELAASRCRSMTPADILEHLDDRFLLLSGSARRSRQRQATMEATIDWSYRSLGQHEQGAFRRLSVFAGPFDLADAAAVLGCPHGQALTIVDDLTAKSLLATDLSAGHARHRLLETLRAYGQQRLLEAGEVEEARDRHLAHFVVRLPALEDLQAHTAGQTRWMEAHQDDLMQAAVWADARQQYDDLAALATGMFNLWLGQHRPAGIELLEAALSAPLSSTSRLRVLYTRAIAAMVALDVDRWLECTGEVLATDNPSVPLRAMARYHHDFAFLVVDPAGSEAGITEALQWVQGEGGHSLAEILGHMYRGMVRTTRFDGAGALADVEEMQRRYPDDDALPHLESVAHTTAIAGLLLLGRPTEASELADRADVEDGWVWRSARDVLRAVAWAAAGRHDDAAATLVHQAQSLDGNAFPGASDILVAGFGLLALHRGERDRARHLLDHAMGIRTPPLFGLLLDACAELAPDGENPAAAAEAARRRRAVSAGHPWLHGIARVQTTLVGEELRRLDG